MILYRRKLFSTFLLLLLAVSAINARRIDQRRPLRKRHSAKYAPLLRAQESEDDFPSTSTVVDEPPSRSTKLMLFEPSSAGRAQHKRQNAQYAPLERSLESEDSVPSTRTAAAPQRSRSTKLMLLTPAAAGKALETDANSGRTFGHLLMVKSLLGSGSGIGSGGGGGGGGGCYGYGCGNGCYSCGGGGGGNGGNGGGGSGSYLPYIVLNAPTNVTNVNQNNLTNSLPITLTTTTTNNGGQRRVPERYNAIQPVPIPVQMPTQVYQQRESGQQLMNVGSALPAMMFGMNGELIPVLLPAGTHQIPMQVPDSGNRWRDDAGQRWRGNQNANHHNRHSNHNNHNNDNNRNNMRHGHNNPFEVLANSLKRIQYL